MAYSQNRTLLKSLYSAVMTVAIVFVVLFLGYKLMAPYDVYSYSPLPNSVIESLSEDNDVKSEPKFTTGSKVSSSGHPSWFYPIFGISLIFNCVAVAFSVYWSFYTRINENKEKVEQQKHDTIDKFWLREVILKQNVIPVLESLKQSQIDFDRVKDLERSKRAKHKSAKTLKTVFGEDFLTMRNNLQSLSSLPGFDSCYSELKQKFNETQDYILDFVSDEDDSFEGILEEIDEANVDDYGDNELDQFTPRDMYIEIVKIISSKQLDENGLHKN